MSTRSFERQRTQDHLTQKCDNKTLAAVVNGAISGAVSKWADDSQKGFIRGRNGIDHVIEVDARCCIADA